MRDAFPALHDPNNSRLRLIIAIRGDTLVRLLILLLGLFGLNLVDLDAVPRVGEVEIQCKYVGVIDIFTFWLFVEDAVLGAGKGLERPFELRVVYGLLAGLLEAAHDTQNLMISLPRPEKAVKSA